MRVPLPLLIEQEKKRRDSEQQERPVLQIPVPEYPPDYFRTNQGVEDAEPQRGVIVIDIFGEEEKA